jgi:hypothetical protein
MAMTEKDMETMIGDMADFTAEQLSKEEEAKKKLEMTHVLTRFRDMLRGKEFARKCKEDSKKYGVNPSIIKNMYASQLMDKIADTTGVVVEIVGEAFTYLLRLITYVLSKIADISVSALTKLVNIVMFRKVVA